MSYQPDNDTLLFRVIEIPIVPVHLAVVGNTQIIPAVPRPDIPVTRIAAQWASGLELSAGGAAMAQIATGYDESAELWGPCEFVTPIVDASLDETIDDETRGGLQVGRDLLGSLTITFAGPAGLLMLTRSPLESS